MYSENEKGLGYVAAAVINQAITDWRMLVNEGRTYKRRYGFGFVVSLDELRRFFKSAWCEELLSRTTFDGSEILALLEKEREEKWDATSKLD